jgi:hypothetical protein
MARSRNNGKRAPSEAYGQERQLPAMWPRLWTTRQQAEAEADREDDRERGEDEQGVERRTILEAEHRRLLTASHGAHLRVSII